MAFDAAMWVLGAVLIAEVVRSHRVLRRAIEAPPAEYRPPAPYPSVTVVHPIRGLDPGLADNVRASLESDYPGARELLFVFDDESDPAVPVVRTALERRPRGLPARVLFAGAPPPGRTGKLNAMIAATREATSEVIVFADSDMRMHPESVRTVVSALLSEPDVGAAFAPVIAASRARTAGDAGYALLINALYAPQAALLSRKAGSLPFIMGQLMALRRDALAAAGGLDGSDGQLVDDMHIGARMVEAGYRNVLAGRPVRLVEEGMGPMDFVRTFRRWILFSRPGLPQSFSGPVRRRAAYFWIGLVGGVALLALGMWAAGAWLLAAAGLGASLLVLSRAAGAPALPLRFAWVPGALLLLGPFVYLATLLDHRVRWRDRLYHLDQESRLVARP